MPEWLEKWVDNAVIRQGGDRSVGSERTCNVPEWLEKLKVGNAVTLRAGSERIARRISRVTPTEIHVGQVVFGRNDGIALHFPRWSIEDDEAERARAKGEPEHEKRLRGEIRRAIDVGGLTLDQLERIHAVLNEGQAAE